MWSYYCHNTKGLHDMNLVNVSMHSTPKTLEFSVNALEVFIFYNCTYNFRLRVTENFILT